MRALKVDSLAIIIALTALSYCINGYFYGISNQALQIPLVQFYIDPTLYPGDPTAGGFASYCTYLYPLVAKMVKATGLSIRTIYLAGHIAARFLLLAAIFLLAFELFQDKLAGYIAIVLVLAASSKRVLLGGEVLLWSYFSHSCLAWPVALLAILLLIHGKLWQSLVVLGLLMNINGLVAAHVALLFIPYMAYRALRRGPKETVALILGGAAMLACAAPVLRWKVKVSQIPTDPARWLAAMRIRHPNTFPTAWSWHYWVGFLVFLGLLALSWPLLKRVDREKKTLITTAIASFAAFCVAGLVWGDLFAVKTVVELQLFRASKAVFLLGCAIIGAWLAAVARRSKPAFACLCLPLLFLLLAGGHNMLNEYRDFQKEQYFRDVAHFALANTPRSAKFLTPPYKKGFRIWAKRPIVGDWKDGTLSFFSSSLSSYWLGLMNRFTGGRIADLARNPSVRTLKSLYLKLPPQEIVKIARDYGASYIVTSAKRELPGYRPIFENRYFKLFRL